VYYVIYSVEQCFQTSHSATQCRKFIFYHNRKKSINYC